MKAHVRVLVCGDEQVGKSSFISTVISRHFPERVPHVMADVHIPPEENDDDVHCTISDSSALPGDRAQLLANIEHADSIVLVYAVRQPESLTNLESFWLPLIGTHTEGIPVIIVRNKVDLLTEEVGGRSDEELRRDMAPLKERFKFFHTSLECSSVNQIGLNQVFHHALNAALYPIGPLFDTKVGQLRPRFDRAIRRLFRIYDRDGDGLLDDDELNSFQYESFRLNLSAEDILVLKRILTKAAGVSPEISQPVLVVPASEQSPGGITVDGFIRLMRLFIDKKQMKAPWKALYQHNYDEEVKLRVPSEVMDPPPGPSGGGWHNQVLSPRAERFVLSLFEQFSSDTVTSTGRVLTQEDQKQIFGVIPDPACPAWNEPRSTAEFDWQDGSYELFGRLRRPPGAPETLTVEGWLAHWQMLAAHSPSLAREHLYYAGLWSREDMFDMLVSAQGKEANARRQQRQQHYQTGGGRVIQMYVLGRRGCGRSRVVRGLRLGENLRSRQRAVPTAASAEGEEEEEPEIPQTCAAFACIPPEEVNPGSPRSPRRGQSETFELQCVTVTEVPEAFTDAFAQEQAWRCDMAVLVFDPSSRESLDYISRMQATLPEEVARVVVACMGPSGIQAPSVVKSAEEMCKELELSPPVLVEPESGGGLEGEGGLRERVVDLDGPGLVPHAEKSRKKRDRNRAIRTASIVTLGLVAVVAVAGYYSYSQTEGARTKSRENTANTTGAVVSWRANVGGALRTPVRVAQRAAAAAADFWRRWLSAGAEIGRDAGYFRAAGTVL